MAIVIDDKELFEVTFEQYLRMAEIGILPEKGIELIDGLVVKMSAPGDRHVLAVRRLTQALILAADSRYVVDPQSTIRLNEKNGPDPDITISRDIDGTTRANSETIALIIEVADTSLKYDSGEKRERYAQGEIPEYWVVDLLNDCLHIFARPADGAYRDAIIVPAGESAKPLAFPDVIIDVAHILGHAR